MEDPYKAVVALALGLSGLATVFASLRRQRGWNPEAAWIPRPAEILNSRVVDDGDTIRPLIDYRWQDDSGGWHNSDRIMPLESWVDGDAYARRLVEQFPVGHKTTAYVHPSDPARSVLLNKPAASGGPEAMLAVGALLLTLSLVMFWAAFRSPSV